jgi:hypothetical protein
VSTLVIIDTNVLILRRFLLNKQLNVGYFFATECVVFPNNIFSYKLVCVVRTVNDLSVLP